MKNPVEAYFSSVAPTWDAAENTPVEKIYSLLDMVDLKEGMSVLDIACGTGIISSKLSEYTKTKVEAIDLSPKMIEIAKKKNEGNPNVDFKVQDFLLSDYQSQFDAAIIYNAYPHFIDRKALAKRLHDALKDNGIAAIIHSMGRDKLNAHHDCVPENVTSELGPVFKEAEHFKEYFEVIKTLDENDRYLLLLKKK